jgi:quinol monooxygenase YgiN
MATFLAHILIKEGREADFERIVATLSGATHENEKSVLRYEYWRGAEPRTYYAHASFDDFGAFIEHQTSEHHEAAGPGLKEVIESIHVEWVDPVLTASPLPPTDPQPLPEGSSVLAAKYHESFAVDVQPWWSQLR